METTSVDAKATTNLPPCCLKIFQDKYILVGTYELDKPTGNRTGSVDIYDPDLNLLKTYPTNGAILDLKLSPFDDTLVATAHSTGNVMLWHVNTVDEVIDLELIANLFAFENDTLISSLHFSPLKPNIMCVTTTSGETATIDIERGADSLDRFTSVLVKDSYEKIDTNIINVQGNDESGINIVVESFSEHHSLECWTAEFGQIQPLQDVIFTGGDDSTIIAHDLRSKDLIWSNNRIHEAGVVSIKCSSETFRHSRPTSLITGSYDDQIRSFDLRMLGESIYPGKNIPVGQLCSANLGGGVWRFSELPKSLRDSHNNKDRLMVCCMYDGARIISLDESQESNDAYFQVEKSLKQGHESMCYGGDWSSKFVATCSFYDKSLQVWQA